ncbi:MAG: hypothetical protein MJE12_21385, partial [Alphaproteobacteria bacterium]|nr:hypothetical protein [Alphaproteobacteria bacterium]
MRLRYSMVIVDERSINGVSTAVDRKQKQEVSNMRLVVRTAGLFGAVAVAAMLMVPADSLVAASGEEAI